MTSMRSSLLARLLRQAILPARLLALVACLVFRAPLEQAGFDWFAVAAAVGVALGLVGMLVVQVIRRRAGQPAEGSSD